MILEVGKAGKVRFVRGIKKTNIFEIGEYGMVVEREKNTIYLYATNNRCSQIYAVATLGDNSLMKGKSFLMVGAYAKDILVLDAGELQVVVDYGKQKIAVNQPQISVVGKGPWGPDARMEWEPWFGVMFGDKVDPALMPKQQEEEAVETPAPVEEELPADVFEAFWNWFAGYEEELVDKTLEGGDAAETAATRIRLRLRGVFSYEKLENIEFSLGGDGDKNELTVYHFNQERMKQDALTLGEAMPAELAQRWNYRTEA